MCWFIIIIVIIIIIIITVFYGNLSTSRALTVNAMKNNVQLLWVYDLKDTTYSK
jgi:uncharacterized protein (UPF0333 family)